MKKCAVLFFLIIFLNLNLNSWIPAYAAMTRGIAEIQKTELPQDLEEKLLSHPWGGFITNVDSTSNSQTQVLINFVRDEMGSLNATITLYNYETGNGRFNFTRFADIKYNDLKEQVLIAFWPPLTPKNTKIWILESTLIKDTFISGLFLEQPRPEEPDVFVEKGTFRIE